MLGLDYKYDSNNGKLIYNKMKKFGYNYELKNNIVKKYFFNEYPLDKEEYIIIHYYSNYDQYAFIKHKDQTDITYDMIMEEKVKGKRNINENEKNNIENLDDINADILYEMDISQDDLFDFANYYLMNNEVLKRYTTYNN